MVLSPFYWVFKGLAPSSSAPVAVWMLDCAVAIRCSLQYRTVLPPANVSISELPDTVIFAQMILFLLSFGYRTFLIFFSQQIILAKEKADTNHVSAKFPL